MLNTVQAPGEWAFFSPQGHGMLKGEGTNLARKINSAIPNEFQLANAERTLAWTTIQWALQQVNNNGAHSPCEKSW